MNLPQNIDAEQSVIGSIIFDNSLFEGLSHLKPSHFSQKYNADIWAAISDQLSKNKKCTAVTLQASLRGDPDFEACGGLNYLNALWDKCSPLAATSSAVVIVDEWIRRSTINLANAATVMASEPTPRPATQLLSDVRAMMDSLEQGVGATGAEIYSADKVATEVVDEIEEVTRAGKILGHMTGLRCIDYRLGGLHAGSLIVIGARPGMGKTALARALAHGAAVRSPDSKVLFLGIEMGPREMMQREISALTAEMGTGVEYRDMSRGSVSPHDVTILRRAQSHVPKNFMIVDSPNLTVDDVRRHIYALRRESNVVAVFIDYLQIMKRPPASGRNDTAVLGEMTSALKQIARATGVSIILLSQLSRGVESRDDKRPMLSDLRESGSIEQDADAVLFPYREAYYLERENTENMSLEQEMNLAKKRNKMDVLCLKNRRGSIGTDEQVYYPEYDYITDKEGGQ